MREPLLSIRGAKAAQSPVRVDLELYFQATEDLYHPLENPEGKFPLNVAENKLNWPKLEQKIREVYTENTIPSWVSRYGDAAGIESFREAVAWYLGELLFQSLVDPDTLAVSSGLTSVIEQTAFILGNPGDVAVIPAPSYPVYAGDLGVKSGIERYDLITHHEIEDIRSNLPLSLVHLENAKEEIEASGRKFKMLILTTPDNPTGGIYSFDQLSSIANWCIDHQIHLIVNEIYGLSIINIHHSAIAADYENVSQYISFGKTMSELNSPFLHLWYSFSKDFGISGFRVGVLHSYNEEVLAAYRNINLTHGVSNLTQWTLQMILEDHLFVKQYILQNQKLLTESYATVAKALKECNTGYNPSRGSLFIWIDLSHLMNDQSSVSEESLWLDIFQKTGILLTPTNGFGHTKKGLFRMVISYYDAPGMSVAMKRLTPYLANK